jgi:hypothetical protein
VVDQKDIERIRQPGFPIARRGYDQRAVDNFLAGLADWLETDAATDLGHVAVARKLEMVGKSTAHILLTTERESDQMRRQAQDECAELRSEAEAAALAIRQAAEDHARKVREKAEQDARKTGETAAAKAKATIEEGERRRAQIEEVVGRLNARRDGALGELDRLLGEIAATIDEHGPGERREGARSGGRKPSAAKEPADGEQPPPEKRSRQGRATATPTSR